MAKPLVCMCGHPKVKHFHLRGESAEWCCLGTKPTRYVVCGCSTYRPRRRRG